MNRTPEERAKYCEDPIFKTDLSNPTSACLADVRATILKARNQINDIQSGKGWEDRLTPTEGLLTCGLVTMDYVMDEIFQHEIDSLDAKYGQSYKFSSRGIGLDQVDCCFVCSATRRNAEAKAGNNIYLHNIAAHLDSATQAEVLNLFPRGARMDYYHGDPKAPQIKIVACDLHLPNLQHLHDSTSYYRRIREGHVAAALEFKAKEPA